MRLPLIAAFPSFVSSSFFNVPNVAHIFFHSLLLISMCIEHNSTNNVSPPLPRGSISINANSRQRKFGIW